MVGEQEEGAKWRCVIDIHVEGACAEAVAAVCVGPVDQGSTGYVQRWRAEESARAAR